MKRMRLALLVGALTLAVSSWLVAAPQQTATKERPAKPAAAQKEAAPPLVVEPADKPAPRDRAGWMDRHNSINARIKQGNVDLVFIGDSITQGWETAGKATWEKFYAKRNAANLGIGGDRTQHVLWRLENGNIEGTSPKLAVIMIGTNNSGDNKPGEIASGIRAIVKKLRKELPQTKILLLAIFPRGENNDDPRRQVNLKTNKRVSKLADNEAVCYLDIADKFLQPDGTLPKEIMPDLLHPKEKGYALWAEAIEPMVAKLMGETK